MRHTWARASIERLTAEVKAAGYKVHESEPLDYGDGTREIMLDIEGYGELFEAYFTQKPSTGNWCWTRGFHHVGMKGDTFRPLHEFKDLVLGVAKSAQEWYDDEVPF